jgi:hypothetical protein
LTNLAGGNLKACFNTSSVFAGHALGGLFGFYSLNIDKISVSDLAPVDLLKTDMMRNQLFNTYWLENSIIWWEERLVEQFNEYIADYRNVMAWIIAIQSVIMLTLGGIVLFKV